MTGTERSAAHQRWTSAPASAIALVTFFGSWAALAWVVMKSLGLRPAGDDYCWAVGAAYGPLDGLRFWWETFAGYAVHNGSLTYVVGMPLLHLPVSLVSAVPFLIAALAVGLVSLLPLLSSRSLTVRQRLFVLAALPTVMVLWWVYWWFPMTQDADGTNAWLAVSMVHNQNINGGYVIEVAVAIALWFSAWLLVKHRGSKWLWLFAVAGAWSALSGPALAVGNLLLLVAALVWWLWFGRDRESKLLTGILIGAALIVVFSLVAHVAPGTQARANRMGTSFDLSLTRIGEWFIHVFPDSALVWIEAFSSPGLLIGFGTVISLGYAIRKLGFAPNMILLRNLTLAAVGFALTLAVASRITNFFVYDAPYHAVPARIAAFLAVLWGGLALGVFIAERWNRQNFVAAPLLLVALVVTLSGAAVAVHMTVAIDARKTEWDQGPAPVIGIVTDYLEWPNARTCWQDLIQIRPDLPKRGQGDPPYVFQLGERRPVLT